jgi:hypothetical protein
LYFGKTEIEISYEKGFLEAFIQRRMERVAAGFSLRGGIEKMGKLYPILS